MQIYELRDALAAAESPALMLETLLPLTIDPLPLGKSGSETLWNGEGLLPIFPFDAPFETSEEIPARLSDANGFLMLLFYYCSGFIIYQS